MKKTIFSKTVIHEFRNSIVIANTLDLLARNVRTKFAPLGSEIPVKSSEISAASPVNRVSSPPYEHPLLFHNINKNCSPLRCFPCEVWDGNGQRKYRCSSEDCFVHWSLPSAWIPLINVSVKASYFFLIWLKILLPPLARVPLINKSFFSTMEKEFINSTKSFCTHDGILLHSSSTRTLSCYLLSP